MPFSEVRTPSFASAFLKASPRPSVLFLSSFARCHLFIGVPGRSPQTMTPKTDKTERKSIDPNTADLGLFSSSMRVTVAVLEYLKRCEQPSKRATVSRMGRPRGLLEARDPEKPIKPVHSTNDRMLTTSALLVKVRVWNFVRLLFQLCEN